MPAGLYFEMLHSAWKSLKTGGKQKVANDIQYWGMLARWEISVKVDFVGGRRWR